MDPVVSGLRNALFSRPLGRNGLPPPNRYSFPPAAPLPGTLFAEGRFAHVDHELAATL